MLTMCWPWFAVLLATVIYHYMPLLLYQYYQLYTVFNLILSIITDYEPSFDSHPVLTAMKPLNHDCHPTIEMFHVFSRRGDDDLANGLVGSDLLATLQHLPCSCHPWRIQGMRTQLVIVTLEKKTFFRGRWTDKPWWTPTVCLLMYVVGYFPWDPFTIAIFGGNTHCSAVTSCSAAITEWKVSVSCFERISCRQEKRQEQYIDMWA